MNNTTLNKVKGFSLIEVMIAVVISSFAIVNYSGLQINGLKGTHTALIRSQATLLINDMADRIRADATSTMLGGYNTSSLNRSNETKQWLGLIQMQLPLGSGKISCIDSDTTDTEPCSKNSIHTIAIYWDDNKTGTADSSINIEIRQ